MRHSAEARTAFWLEPDKRASGNLGQDLIQSRHEGGYDGYFCLIRAKATQTILPHCAFSNENKQSQPCSDRIADWRILFGDRA